MTKKIDKAKLAWLDEELSDLSVQGVIDESVAQSIRGYYETAGAVSADQPQDVKKITAADSRKRSYFLAALVSLGAFLIGSGLILLFAHNWDMLSVRQRLITAFIPIVLAACLGIYTIVKEKDSRWQESSAFLTAVGFAVLTALVSQIYHIGGTFYDFSKLIMAVSLPLVYLFRSQMLCAVYCIFLFALMDYRGFDQHYGDILYFLAIAPFILYYLFFKKTTSIRTAWMRYVCLLPLFWIINQACSGYRERSLCYFAAAGLLYLAGLHYNEMKLGSWRNPWLPLGWFFFSMLLLFDGAFSHKHNFSDRQLILLFIFFAAQVFVATRRITPLKAAIVAVSLLRVIATLLGLGNEHYVASACLLALGVLAMREGMSERGFLKMNAGMLQVLMFAMFEFAYIEISLLVRALMFIVIGATFIVSNVYMSRNFKSESVLPASETEVKNDVEK